MSGENISLASMIQTLAGFTPAQPQVVVNNAPMPTPLGDVDWDEEETYFQGLEPQGESLSLKGVGDWDDDDDDEEEDFYLGEIVTTLKDTHPSIGGLFDGSRRARRKKNKQTRKQLTSTTQAINNDLNAVERELAAQKKINKSQAKAIARLHKRQKQVEVRTVQNKFTEAALSTGRMVPGAKAYSLLTSEQHIDILDGISTALTPGAAEVTNVALGTYGAPADATAAQNNALADTAILAAKVNALIAEHNKIVAAFAKAEMADKVAEYKKVGSSSSLLGIMRLLPGNLVDREIALMQAGVQYVLTTVPKPGAANGISFTW